MKRSRFWTTAEVATLKQHYPSGGLSACETVLPGRTRGSIYQHAAALGLRHPGALGLRDGTTLGFLARISDHAGQSAASLAVEARA